MHAVPCQAQTEAVFISHAATDPLACWDAGLQLGWLFCAAPWWPASLVALPPTCLPESVFLPVWKSPTDSLSVFLSNYSPGRLGAASLLVSHLERQCCSSFQAVSLSSSLAVFFFFFGHSARLLPSQSSGFPAEGCLDWCRITRTLQTHHSNARKEARKDIERKWWVGWKKR